MAPSDPRQTKFVLDESRIPRAWYNIAADLPVAAVAAAPPGHAAADRPGRPRAALPDGAHRPGGLGRARDRDPRARPRRLPALPAEPAVPGAPARAGARYAGPHLLQVRGRQPGRQPQAEHGDPAGVLQQGGGRQAPRDRDRRRPVGERPRVRRRPVRPRGQGLHGPRQLRPEAVPPDPDGDVRRGGRGEPVARRPTTVAPVLAETPDSPGSLGMAISEAVEDAATRDDTKYALGSVLNHVLLHQTVIGQEAIEQMGMAGESPDVVIGCTGGGSNFAGLTFPFLGRNFRDGAKHRIIAAEPEAAPSLTRGVYAYDFGDTGQDGADRQDAHARLGLHPRTDPRRRPALPRHVAAGQPAQGARLHRGAQRPPARRPSRPASSSPGPRASCRRPSRPTRSGSRSTRRWPPGRPARRGSSCSTCAATATSTCRPTSGT